MPQFALRRMYAHLTALVLLSTGCHGPLTIPMVDRLDAEQQTRVDNVWGVLLDSAPPLDRTLLLDILLLHQLHHLGVDSLLMTSTKRVGDGYVEMQIRFERGNPDLDEFSLAYFKADGREVRRERFAREDIENRVEFFTGPVAVDEAAPPETREAQERREADREARMREIEALLQPIIEADNPRATEAAPDAPFPLVIMPT